LGNDVTILAFSLACQRSM